MISSIPFKAGDKVRVKPGKEIIGTFHPLEAGVVYTITRADTPVGCYLDRHEYQCYDYDRLELVPEEVELERLVRTANEGVKAMAALRKKYVDQVVYQPPEAVSIAFSDLMQLFVPAYFSDGVDVFRVKDELAFTPFCVGSWEVKVKNDRLHIGCHHFPVDEARNALVSLVRNKRSSAKVERATVRACRDGIYSADRDLLPWADAEKILEALEKARI